MKIVIAIDSFKGSVSAVEAGERLERGIRKVVPQAEVVKIPISDGGEGLLIPFFHAVGGTMRKLEVKDPLGRTVGAEYLKLPDGTAVIEAAQACGLPLLKREERDLRRTTTYGVGEMILGALDDGCRRLVIGVGGSATNDGGAGMAQALGASFSAGGGRELNFGGEALLGLTKIDAGRMDSRLRDCRIEVACDVTNPLYGPEGAAAVYGPQKGASPEEVSLLDRAMRRYAEVIAWEMGKNVADLPGSGAAGGLGAGLIAFCGAQICRGIEVVLDVVGFDRITRDADLVITGEGKIDAQTSKGKVPVGVAVRTKGLGDIPVVAVVGGIGEGAELAYRNGIDAILPIVPGPVSVEKSVERGTHFLEEAGERLMRLLLAGVGMKRRETAGNWSGE